MTATTTPRTQVNSATGIMGVTGSGKSSLGATLAKYLWRKYKKVLLYYSSDGGGFPAEVQACIGAGIIRVFRMYTRDPGDLSLSFETCQRAAQMWWPKRINPATGEVEPGVELVPPIAIRYEMRCSQGHLVKSVPSQALIQPTVCPECRKPVTTTDMRVTRTTVQNKGFEDVGGVFYDGLSSMLAWELREMGHRSGRLELKGEESSIGGKVISGDLKFGGTTRSHVGFVQARGEELVHLTLGIPNLVVPPVFTMLTHEDVDERSLSIIGPKIAGRAKTDEAPQWFGNLMEAAKIPALTGSGEQRVLYLSEFTDSRGVRHLCKHRGSPGTMPSMLADPPDGDTNPDVAFSQFNLGVFFELLDAALEKRIADVHAEFPDAPGLPAGIVEVGDSSIVEPPTPVVRPAAQPQPAQPAQATPQPAASTTPAGAVATPAPTATVSAPRSRSRKAAPATPPAVAPAPPAATAPAVPATTPAAATAMPAAPAPAPATQPPAPQASPATPAAPVPATPTAPPAGASAPQAGRPVPGVPGAPRPAGVAPPAGARPAAARPVAAVPRPPAAAPRPPMPAPRPAGPGDPELPLE